jgi:hypothetical protein
MALALRQNTPSQFYNNRVSSPSFFSYSPDSAQTNNYPSRGITYFDGDNQRAESEYMPNTNLWLPFVISQNKLIELEEYRGFSFVEWGKITVSYNKKDVEFTHDFKFICLNRQAQNDYYPDPYLVICFELELEGSGESEAAAFDNMYQLLDVYFNRTREIYENPDEYVNVINENITQQNPWKLSFDRTYKRAQKLEIINTDYHHQII